MKNSIPGHIICKSTHPDGDLLVVERDGARYLYLGSDALQSAMELKNPHYLKLTYTQAMTAFMFFTPSPQRALLIGLGGGALAKFLLNIFHYIQIDAVELREDVVRIAHSHFFTPHDARLQITLDDAFSYTKHHTRHSPEYYDLILVDAYDQNGLSPSVKHTEFYENCQRLLNRGGTLVFNMWAASSHQLKEHIEQLHLIFNTQPLCLPVPEKGNIIVFIGHPPFPKRKLKAFKPQAQQLENTLGLPFNNYLSQLIKQHSRSWLQRLFA